MAVFDSHQADELFAQLSPRQEQILVSLPYRAGLYVSYADVTGGWEAQERELQSLSNILREFCEDYCKSAFAQKVLMETLNKRSQWPSWSQEIEFVPGEAGEIVATLAGFFSEKDLLAFKEVMVDIALAVAMAFREVGEGAVARPGAVKDLLGLLTGALKEAHPLDHINISANERAALDRLCAGLGYAKFL